MQAVLQREVEVIYLPCCRLSPCSSSCSVAPFLEPEAWRWAPVLRHETHSICLLCVSALDAVIPPCCLPEDQRTTVSFQLLLDAPPLLPRSSYPRRYFWGVRMMPRRAPKCAPKKNHTIQALQAVCSGAETKGREGHGSQASGTLVPLCRTSCGEGVEVWDSPEVSGSVSYFESRPEEAQCSTEMLYSKVLRMQTLFYNQDILWRPAC